MVESVALLFMIHFAPGLFRLLGHLGFHVFHDEIQGLFFAP